jgi:co-chaperonin GroES (HSP10)
VNQAKPYGPRVMVGEIGKVDDGLRNSGLIIPATVAERKSLVKGLVIEVGEGVEPLEREMTVYFREDSAYDLGGFVILDARDVLAYEES